MPASTTDIPITTALADYQPEVAAVGDRECASEHRLEPTPAIT